MALAYKVETSPSEYCPRCDTRLVWNWDEYHCLTCGYVDVDSIDLSKIFLPADGGHGNWFSEYAQENDKIRRDFDALAVHRWACWIWFGKWAKPPERCLWAGECSYPPTKRGKPSARCVGHNGTGCCRLLYNVSSPLCQPHKEEYKEAFGVNPPTWARGMALRQPGLVRVEYQVVRNPKGDEKAYLMDLHWPIGAPTSQKRYHDRVGRQFKAATGLRLYGLCRFMTELHRRAIRGCGPARKERNE